VRAFCAGLPKEELHKRTGKTPKEFWSNGPNPSLTVTPAIRHNTSKEKRDETQKRQEAEAGSYSCKRDNISLQDDKEKDGTDLAGQNPCLLSVPLVKSHAPGRKGNLGSLSKTKV